MALNPTTYAAQLAAAFVKTTWAECATDIATATDTFILGGSVSLTATVVVTPPSGTPYPMTGTGTGLIATIGPVTLAAAIAPAFASPTWATVGNVIATAIDAHVKACIITSSYVGSLVGAGVGVAAPVGLSALSTTLTTQFTAGLLWATVATEIAAAVQSFLNSTVITTTDAGAVPPAAWVGTGTGYIV